MSLDVRPFVPSDAEMLLQNEKNGIITWFNIKLKNYKDKIANGEDVFITASEITENEKKFIIETYEATGEWRVTCDSDRDGSYFKFTPKKNV